MFESSDFLLKISHWYFGHKSFFKKILIGLLLAVNILIWLSFSGKLTRYILDTDTYQQLTIDMKILAVDFAGYKAKHQAQELRVKDTVTIPAKTNTYNLLAKIENPNKEWVAEVITYRFQLPGLETDPQTSFVFPGQTKALTAFNISYASSSLTPPAATVKIENIHWHRYSPTDRLIIPDFAVENVQQTIVTPAPRRGEEEGSTGEKVKMVTRVQADLTNNTFYGFWRVDVQVIALDYQNTILDFNTIRLTEFQAGEKRHVDLTFKKALNNVTTIEIFPEVDTFDPTAIMPFGAGSSQPL